MPALLATSCSSCRQPGDVLCRQCRFAVASSPASRIPASRIPGSSNPGSSIAASSMPGADTPGADTPGGIVPASDTPDSITAALSFDGAVRSAVLALKFGNKRAVGAVLAEVLVRRLGLADPGADRFDLVTWAPTSRRRAVDRGYDQAELLARAVARQLGVPCRRLLYRVHGSPQAGRSRAERLEGPAFRVRRAGALRVLVVDDVVTTGATLTAAGAALRAAGIHDVRLIAVAATPSGAPAARHAKARAQAAGRLEPA